MAEIVIQVTLNVGAFMFGVLTAWFVLEERA